MLSKGTSSSMSNTLLILLYLSGLSMMEGIFPILSGGYYVPARLTSCRPGSDIAIFYSQYDGGNIEQRTNG